MARRNMTAVEEESARQWGEDFVRKEYTMKNNPYLPLMPEHQRQLQEIEHTINKAGVKDGNTEQQET